ncbi:probable inactive peptidyl-prolyl cis-trans isomerase-like 6 isoform X2 [Antedon mediterranea]|uniref:probable inactive peptidyl-prolyl cis-trans isomerase-like 6 isoform X2 n=1 Tax=Antedon mediterranea TaxID=105859 RepID=UPI003AF86D95
MSMMEQSHTQREVQVLVVGLLADKTFHKSKNCAEDLLTKFPEHFLTPEVIGLLEFEWKMYLEEKRKELKGEMWAFKDKTVAFVNGQVIGGPVEFLKWAMEAWEYQDFRPEPLYSALAEEAYKQYLIKTGLFTDKCPKTCENFRALCTGENGTKKGEVLMPYHYKNSIIHRVVPNGWIQGGDILQGVGTGGESIYGEFFADENFSVSHSSRGILGMANQGRHTNGSQFYVTLRPAAWMDHKYVAFGRVIEGTDLLEKLETQETYNERPKTECQIAYCGVLDVTQVS